VQSLDGRPLRIEAANVTPETVKIIPGEGMPNSKVSKHRRRYADIFVVVQHSWRQP
jgi:hypothetical protein